MTLLVGFGAVNTGNNLLYLLLGVMLALIVLSGVLSESTLRALRAGRRLPQRAYAGQACVIEHWLENGKRRVPSFSLRLREQGTGLEGDQRPSSYLLRVDAGVRASGSARLVWPRRGLLEFSGFELSTRFPFGLFDKSRDLAAPASLLVYPARVPAPRLPPAGGLPQGLARRARAGRGEELFGLRDLRPGDDPRDLHPKVSAKRDRPIVREHEQPQHPRLTLCFDNRWPADDGTPALAARARAEYAVAACASLAEELTRAGWSLGLRTRACHLPPERGPQQLELILRELALLGFQGEPGRPPDEAPPPPPLPAAEACLLLGDPRALEPFAGGRLVATLPLEGALDPAGPAREGPP